MPQEQTLSQSDKVDGQTLPSHLSDSAVDECVRAAAAMTDDGRPQDSVNILSPLDTNENHPDFYYELGRASRQTGDLMVALKAFDRAVELGLNTAELFNEIGMALDCFGHPEMAEQALLRALALAPEEAVLYYNLATILAGRSRIDDAGKACELALHYAPDFTAAQELLAQLCEPPRLG